MWAGRKHYKLNRVPGVLDRYACGASCDWQKSSICCAFEYRSVIRRRNFTQLPTNVSAYYGRGSTGIDERRQPDTFNNDDDEITGRIVSSRPCRRPPSSDCGY